MFLTVCPTAEHAQILLKMDLNQDECDEGVQITLDSAPTCAWSQPP